MRITCVGFLFLLTALQLNAQLSLRTSKQYFPIKINQLWGLMDEDGKVIVKPEFEAIGEFKKYGYATMQRKGKVGLINNKGKEIVVPLYDDVKILDSLLIAVLEERDWSVIDLNGKTILSKGYEQVCVWKGHFLGFKKNEKWGIANAEGKIIAEPRYDEIDLIEEGFFQTKIKNGIGLLTLDGKEILPNTCEQIKVYNKELFFFQKEQLWGAVTLAGSQLIKPRFNSFFPISEHFIKFIRNSKVFLYSVAAKRIITKGEYDTYYGFSKKNVLCKKQRRLGLLDVFGNVLLSPKYFEIQSYGKNTFRVNFNGKWGVVDTKDETIISFDYDYIAPLKKDVCVVKKGRLLGIVNFNGEEQVAAEYNRIQLEKNKAKAWKGKVLTLFNFDENGEIKGEDEFENYFSIKIGGKKKKSNIVTAEVVENDYQLNKFEWFYSPQLDKWGLRKLEDGEIQIVPTFEWINVERNHGFTVVGIEKWNRYVFDRTTYRFDMVFGLVNNANGLLVTKMDLLDVRFSDLEKGYEVARVVFSNGTHGLVNKIGAFVARDYAYIGAFHEGMARMSTKGKLSGNLKNKKEGLGKVVDYLDKMLSTNYMTDYTQHDLDFRTNAELICEDCEWGYVDTSGNVIVATQFSYAEDFVNKVGIVQKDKKVGAIGRNGEVLLDCVYDEINFLENTDEQILQVYNYDEKYGLIDTFGKVTVNLRYDELGDYSEERLAVMRNNKWGFVGLDGEEVVDCRYRKVNNFQEGLAAVKLGNKWGFINIHGDVVVDFKYQRAGNFKDGLAWVGTSSGVGYIDTKGTKVILPKFNRAFDFENNVARVIIDGKYGLIKKNGEFFLKPKYKSISRFNEYGTAIVQLGNDRIRYGLISRTGDLITQKQFHKILPFKEGMAVVKHKNKYGFIDTNGKLVIDNKYSKVNGFSEGMAMVQKNGQCGFINKKGEVVVALKYSRCKDFKDGNAVVYKGLRNAGLVDKTGHEVIKPGLNRLIDFSDGRGLVRDDKWRYYYITEEARLYEGYYEQAKEFQHGVAVVQMNGRWGVINQKGMQVIPPKYDKIETFEDGYAKVRIKGFSGLTNLKGEVIVKPNYEYISYAGKGLFRVEQGDKVGYFDTKGDWVWELSE